MIYKAPVSYHSHIQDNSDDQTILYQSRRLKQVIISVKKVRARSHHQRQPYLGVQEEKKLQNKLIQP